MKRFFSKIILIGRPASGKSEIIDFLLKTTNFDRMKKFHLASNIIVIDDFPMLWAWFEEDYILQNVLGKERLHTTDEGYFKEKYLWNLLIERISLEYKKSLKEFEDNNPDVTWILEFARGSEHGGYEEAFQHLSEEILNDAVVLYVKVPYEESLRKNRARKNPDKPHSILEHSLDDRVLETLYKECDWDEFSKNDPLYLEVKGVKVPYVVFDNMPSKTDSVEHLEPEMESLMKKMWGLYNN